MSGVGMISNSSRYLGGLKKCVPKKFVLKSLNKGVTLVGGCCEVKPRHIEAIKNLF